VRDVGILRRLPELVLEAEHLRAKRAVLLEEHDLAGRRDHLEGSAERLRESGHGAGIVARTDPIGVGGQLRHEKSRTKREEVVFGPDREHADADGRRRHGVSGLQRSNAFRKHVDPERPAIEDVPLVLGDRGVGASDRIVAGQVVGAVEADVRPATVGAGRRRRGKLGQHRRPNDGHGDRPADRAHPDLPSGCEGLLPWMTARPPRRFLEGSGNLGGPVQVCRAEGRSAPSRPGGGLRCGPLGWSSPQP
jgi:hypothetical protein